MEFAAEMFRHALPAFEEHDVTVALEPLGPRRPIS